MTKGYELPYHVAKAVKHETGGNTVQWVGQPDVKKAFLATAPIWLMAIPWTVFAIGWELGALTMFWGTPHPTGDRAILNIFSFVFPIFGIPFVCIGLGMLAAPFWVALKARNQAHVVTTSALLDINAKANGTVTVKSTAINKIVQIERTERSDGTGSLKFILQSSRDRDRDAVEMSESWIGIPHVQHVETLVRRAMSPTKA
jgi:hypothetical protein